MPDDDGLSTLRFDVLQRASVRRCEDVWHGVDAWSPTEWSNALAGEAGETCNKTKKRLRGDPVTDEEIMDEVADTVCYAVLLAARLRADLGAAVVRKFNRVSARVGSTVRLDADAS